MHAGRLRYWGWYPQPFGLPKLSWPFLHMGKLITLENGQELVVNLCGCGEKFYYKDSKKCELLFYFFGLKKTLSLLFNRSDESHVNECYVGSVC